MGGGGLGVRSTVHRGLGRDVVWGSRMSRRPITNQRGGGGGVGGGEYKGRVAKCKKGGRRGGVWNGVRAGGGHR